jgi:hypothetical protein
MNLATVDKIAKAVLYEGYMLYPYRPSSVKNQQRWNFGVLCPHTYSEAQNGSEAWTMQTECLIEGSLLTGIEVRVRFLQLVQRSVGSVMPPISDPLSGEIPEFNVVERVEVNGRVYRPWQEAIERELILPLYNVEALTHKAVSEDFNFSTEKYFEYLADGGGRIVGVVVRERRAICGVIEVSGERVADGIFKIKVLIRNTTPFEVVEKSNRDEALLSAMASAHTVLCAQDGRFVSLNVGTWPVLVGEEGHCDTVLSSPIILYDYPQIAPESAGDLFDGTEIDEILSLRIMTLTDDEKREMSQSDERAREMLERTETMPVEQLMKLHGVLRGLRPVKEETQ